MSDVEKLKTLLVENDEEDALIFQRHVRQAKAYDVGLQWVSNITEAESALGVEAFDMVFLDLNVGAKLLGMELLKRATGRGETTPFVIVTGSGDEKKAVDAMKNGAYDYIVKDSLSPELIEKTIKAVREQYVARREREELIAKLAEISVTDALTGLANRRRLTGKLAEEIARLGGEVTRSDVLGSKGFARPMKKHHAGIYARVDFSLPPDAVAPLRNRIKLKEGIFRMQIVTASSATASAAAPQPAATEEGGTDGGS